MAKPSSNAQKFIGGSRAPRVQIEYDVEVYGSQKKVELPFVVGVMSDLSGDNTEPLPSIEERRFYVFDTENFDQRMSEINPKAVFNVRNNLTDDGSLINVDLEFKQMDDFNPTEVVRRVPELAALLEARDKLKELIMYMDGKVGAEDIIQKLLSDSNLADVLLNKQNQQKTEVVENIDVNEEVK